MGGPPPSNPDGGSGIDFNHGRDQTAWLGIHAKIKNEMQPRVKPEKRPKRGSWRKSLPVSPRQAPIMIHAPCRSWERLDIIAITQLGALENQKRELSPPPRPSAKIILSTHQPLRTKPMNHSSPNSASRPSPPSEGGATRAAGRPARVPAGGTELARAPDTSSVSQRSQIAPDGADGAGRHPCLSTVGGLALRDPRPRSAGGTDCTGSANPAPRTLFLVFLFITCALLSTASAQDTVNSPLPDGNTNGNGITQTNSAITNAILFEGIWA